MVSISHQPASPPRQLLIQVVKSPLKVLSGRSNSFRSIESLGTLDPLGYDAFVPHLDELPTLEDLPGLEYDELQTSKNTSLEDVPLRKQGRHTKCHMQACDEDHPLSALTLQVDQFVKGPLQPFTQMTTTSGVSVSHLENCKHENARETSIETTALRESASHKSSFGVTRYHTRSHSTAVNRLLNGIGSTRGLRDECKNLNESEMETYCIRETPSLIPKRQRFYRENESFLRMYVAEKQMITNGKLRGMSCEFMKPPRYKNTVKVDEELGIAYRWSKCARRRNWQSLNACDLT